MIEYNNYKVLVTGGAGFIGSHLVEALLGRDTEVCVYDNFDPYYPRAEKEMQISAARTNPRFRLVEGDIRDRMLLDQTLSGFNPNIIVHLAAKAGVRPSLADPEGYADVNVRGTTVVLESARKFGIERIVFASSSSVYGNSGGGPLAESLNTDHPLSPYGATKKACEVLTHTYHHVYSMSVACLRFFTVYGPRQRPDLAIRKFIQLALTSGEIPVFGDGSSKRDYTHIKDILTGILGAMEWVSADQPRYGIFNLGSSNPVTLSRLLQLIEEFCGKPLNRKSLPPQPGDVFQTFADTSLAERELGFHHAVKFEDGLCDFVEWMRKRI